MRKYIFIKQLALTICIIAAFGGILIGITVPHVQAADRNAEECIASSGADQVASVQNACNLCFGSSNRKGRGTLWFTHANAGRNTDVVEATTADVFNGTIPIRMYGQFYSCGTSGRVANRAAYIWFGEAGQENSSALHLTFLNFESDQLYRGTGQGAAYTWYQPLGQNVAGAIDIEKFRTEGSGAKCTIEGNYEICERTVSVNRCNGYQAGGYRNPGNTACYGDNSTIRIKIPKESSNGQYWSKSAAEVPAQADTDASPSSVQSDIDSVSETIDVMTLAESVDVTFWHTLFHDESLVDEPTTEHASFPAYPIKKEDLCTEWYKETYYKDSGDQLDGISPSSGTFCQQEHRGEGGSGTKVSSGTVSVPLNVGETKTVCSTIHYQPKYVSIEPVQYGNRIVGYEVIKDHDSPQDWQSTACVTVHRASMSEEASFWSQSEVIISAQNGDVDAHDLNSQFSKDHNGSTATVELSTDYDSLDVQFKHRIYYSELLWAWYAYEGDGDGHDVKSIDQFPDVTTEWTVTTTVQYEDGEESNEIKGTLHTNAGPGNSGSTVVDATFGIDLTRQSPGNPVKITSKIEFKPALVTLGRRHVDHVETKENCTPSEDDDCKIIVHDYYVYRKVNSSGTGSTAAANATNNPIISTGSTDIDNSILYAGEEQGQIHWNDMKAESLMTRRLQSYEGAVYVVSDVDTYRENIVAGNIGDLSVIRDNRFRDPHDSKSAICSFYSGSHYIYTGGSMPGLNQIVSCDIFDNFTETNLDTNVTTYTESKHSNIVTPDEVGYKYCNSFAFMYEYWYHYQVDEIQDEWTHETEKDYWEVFNSTCRTIVKKPSAALWNGSFMSNGGATTSVAPRYDNASSLFNVPAASQPRRLYGSWSEYLAVLGGNANGFSSGAALGAGILDATIFGNDVSRLTIANQGSLGNSGITNNPTYRTRLRTFLEEPCAQYLNGNADKPSWGTCYGSIPASTTGTNVVVINGDVTLNHNIITTPDGPYANLYRIPRNIIFIHGNLNITSDVTQIDAWLIVDGKINTCIEYNSNTTADTTNLSGSACTKQLIFNGPVMAGSLELRRSFGADLLSLGGQFGGNERYTTGEIFNFRADDYLWAYAQAGRYASSYTESYSRELAPRY